MREVVSKSVQLDLLKGVNMLADVVGSTLGPEGRNVIIDQPHGMPHVTKDGVTVAKSIHVKDRIQNMGIQLVKQAAAQTAREAGDGTTTSTILARHIAVSGYEFLKKNATANPIQMRKGMFHAVQDVTDFIKRCAKPCKGFNDLYHVALVSSNYNEEIAKTVARTKNEIGENGQIIYKQSYDAETRVDIINGMRIDSSIYSDMMLVDLKRKMNQSDNLTMTDPVIFVMDYEVISNNDILPMLKLIMSNAEYVDRNIILMCDNMEGEPIATINNTNRQNPRSKIAVVRNPFAREKGAIMVDICTYTGATLITESSGLKPKDVTLDMAGTCSTAVFKDDGSIIFIESPLHQEEDLLQRIQDLKNKISKETPNTPFHIELKKRLSALTGALGIISVGSSTQSELDELMDIYDDTINAVESAYQEGVVYGGGNTFASAYFGLKGVYTKNDNFCNGYNIVIRSLMEPISYIARNAECNIEDFSERLLLGGVVHVSGGELVCSDESPDFLLDPAKVLRVALRNAVSVASTILTTQSAVMLTNEYVDFQNQMLLKK